MLGDWKRDTEWAQVVIANRNPFPFAPLVKKMLNYSFNWFTVFQEFQQYYTLQYAKHKKL